MIVNKVFWFFKKIKKNKIIHEEVEEFASLLSMIPSNATSFAILLIEVDKSIFVSY